jgi:GNAT superfamily N-acetyltransferase
MPTRWNALFDRNLLDAIREFARWQDGTMILEEDGILLVSGGTDFPVGFSNCVARTDVETAPELVLERAEEFFGQQDRGFTVWVRDPVDADLEELLKGRGLSSRVQSPWMFLDHRPPTRELPTGTTVRLTTDRADLPAIKHVLGEAFAQIGTPPEETARLFVHAPRVLTPVTRFALAEVGGEPAAAAMVLLTGGMGGVYWVGTRPEFARRGLGTACTAIVSSAAFDAGKPMVGLHATPMGLKVYERMGFETSPSSHRWYVISPGGTLTTESAARTEGSTSRTPVAIR